MKFKDLKLSTNLHITFISIYLVVVIMGGISWYQANTLWQQTQSLFEHSLKVRRVLNGLETDIIQMDKNMKKYIMESSPAVRQDILQNLQETKANANSLFNTLSSQYLGPSTDIQKVEKGFYHWDVIMENIVNLVRSGKKKEALKISMLNGTAGTQVNQILNGIHAIGLFSSQKADQFYRKAQIQKHRLLRQLFFLLSIILVLLLLINFLLNRNIRRPIKELTLATKKFSEGNYEARVRYTSENELGSLSAAFNHMAGTIQAQIEREQEAFRFNTTLFKRENLKEFIRNLIKELVKITHSQTGAVYLLNKEKTEFTLYASLGLSEKAKTSFSVKLKEGEFGKALAEKKIVHLKEIPKDTAFIFTTAAGDFYPREIITLPILAEEETAAVISLATIYTYPHEILLLLENIFASLTSRINGVLLFHQIKEQAAKLKKQNNELELQEKELSAQAVELNRQNTELKMQKNQLDEANRLKSTFLSNMSHELRTPLNSVIALSSVLKRKLKTNIPAEEYGYIDVIERNGKQLMELINDVLDLSRIESGRIEIEQTEIDIKGLINEITTLIGPQAENKNITLKSLIKEELPVIQSDANKIRHILQNLVGNAVKFTEKGKVEVTAFRKDNFLHIQVSDTGIGIPEDQLPFIFDEFRQVDSSTSRKYGGTGLGLSIAKKYANMLGGTIQAKSSPGKGSVFTLILPLKMTGSITKSKLPPPPSPIVKNNKPPVPDEKQTKEKIILVVEDSEPAIIQLKDILQEAGFQVMVAHNGGEALEQISKVLPDAMILDLMMPEIDGFQVLQAVRANVDTAHLPVLILTAKHLEGKDLKNLKQNQVYQLLQKGDVNREQLLHIINDMVFAPKETSPEKPETTKEKPENQKIIKTTKGEKPSILVVEDNVDNMLTIKTLLGNNYRVIEAFDGQDGINKAKAHHPDLILMDIAMPVMNGFRAFDAIRKEKSLKHIPIVAVTASALTADREEILHYGFDGYIPKPIDVEQFDKTIQSFFEKNKKS